MNGNDVKILFDTKWGMWRKFISANPLTGSWISFAAGGAVVAVYNLLT